MRNLGKEENKKEKEDENSKTEWGDPCGVSPLQNWVGENPRSPEE